MLVVIGGSLPMSVQSGLACSCRVTIGERDVTSGEFLCTVAEETFSLVADPLACCDTDLYLDVRLSADAQST